MSRAPVRKTLRQQVSDNERWMKFLGNGNSPEIPKSLEYLKKAPRQHGPRIEKGDDPYEATIQAEIIAFLLKHPKVKVVERHNAGVAVEQGSDGKKRYIRYSTIFKVGGVRMRKVDIDTTLKNGKRMVIEVKRKGWKRPTDQREIEQSNYIEHIKAATGYGMFASSVEEVAAMLDSIQV